MKDFPVSGHLLKLYCFSPSIFSLTVEDCYSVYDEIFNENEEFEEEVDKKKGEVSSPRFCYLKNSMS